jgi:hypothetical protein
LVSKYNTDLNPVLQTLVSLLEVLWLRRRCCWTITPLLFLTSGLCLLVEYAPLYKDDLLSWEILSAGQDDSKKFYHKKTVDRIHQNFHKIFRFVALLVSLTIRLWSMSHTVLLKLKFSPNVFSDYLWHLKYRKLLFFVWVLTPLTSNIYNWFSTWRPPRISLV